QGRRGQGDRDDEEQGGLKNALEARYTRAVGVGAGAALSIHPLITSNTWRRLFSNIAKWLLPRMPRCLRSITSAFAPDAVSASRIGPPRRPPRSDSRHITRI